MGRQLRREEKKTRYMKGIVAYCIGFISFVVVVGLIAAFYGVSIDGILTAVCGVFGGQLLLTAFLKIVAQKKDDSPADKG